MTTNVIDRRKYVVASDSRWSILNEAEGYLAFVDDTGFDKIGDRNHASLVCAGDALLIEAWKNWFREPVLDISKLPDTERYDANGAVSSIVVSLVTKPDGRLVYSFGWYLDHMEEAKFSGSGAAPARDCYVVNGCGRTAVASAGMVDPMTGGETKYVEVQTARHNLHQEVVSLKEVEEQLMNRGLVMDLKNPEKVVSIAQWNQQSVAKGLEAGSLSLSAPTGQPHRAWTEVEKNELRKALQNLADFENAASNG